MENIRDILEQAVNVAIIGHVRPDGDCVGSCLGLMNYLKLIAPQLEIQVYLESFSDSFYFLKGADKVSQDSEDGTVYDFRANGEKNETTKNTI